jgi:hypothetical protein
LSIENVKSQEEAENVLHKLLSETESGKMRWGFQPPSTAQSNRGDTHYVLRLRRKVYRLTARRDGSKQVSFMLERPEPEPGAMTALYRLATGLTAD